MSDKKISDLVELTTLAADDVLPVVDASANATKRITGANLSNFPTQPTFGANDVYHQGNVVGTVSQSGGTPTGAVVERGSDANGEYVKFADGTLIMWGTFTADSDLNMSMLGGFRSSIDFEITYPTPAASVQSAVAVPNETDGFSVTTRPNHGGTGGGFLMTAVSSQGFASRTLYFQIMGRWY